LTLSMPCLSSFAKPLSTPATPTGAADCRRATGLGDLRDAADLREHAIDFHLAHRRHLA
jgi:hypothetical protein